MHVLSLSELPGLRPFNAAAAAAVHEPSERHAAQQQHPAGEALLSGSAAPAATPPESSCATGAPLSPAVAPAVTQAPSSPPSIAPVDAAPASTAVLRAADAHSPYSHAASSAQAAALQGPTAAGRAGTRTYAVHQPMGAGSVVESGTASPGVVQPAALAGIAMGSTATNSSVSPGVRHDPPRFTAGSSEAAAAVPAAAPGDAPTGAPSTAHALTASSRGALPGALAAGPTTQQQPRQPAPPLPPEPAACGAADLAGAPLQDALSQLRMENAMLKAEASFAVSQRQPLEEDNRQLRQQAEALQLEPQRLQHELEDTQRQEAILQQELAAVRRELTSLQAAADSLRLQVADLQRQPEAAHQRHSAEGAQEAAALREDCAAAQVQAADSQRTCQAAQQQAAQWQSAADAAQQEAAELRVELGAAMASKGASRLESDSQALGEEGRVTTSQHSHARSAADSRQVAALRAQLAGLIRASQEYSQQRDAEVAQVQAERASLQEQLAVVRGDADTSRLQCQSATAAIDKLVSENASLVDQLNIAHLQQASPSNGGARASVKTQSTRELPGGMRVTTDQLQLLALAEELERLNSQLANERSQRDALRRRALAVIAAGVAPDVAAIQLADVQPPHLLAVDAQQPSQTSPLSTPKPAHDLDSSAAITSVPSAARAGQQPLPAPQDVQSGSFSVQEPQQVQDGVLVAPQHGPGAAGAPDAAPAAAPQPVWLREQAGESASKPAPPQQAAGKRGFWGAVGAYITGADKRQAT